MAGLMAQPLSAGGRNAGDQQYARDQQYPTLFCDLCKASPARSFCHADAARLCLACDKKVGA